MNIDELKLVFNALKQCNSFAFAGGLGLLRATAHRDALDILEKALAQPEPVAHSVIAGVLFDFMGWLTSRKERIVLSSADNASPAVEAITEFAKMRNLSLDDAKVQDWHTGAPQRTEQDIATLVEGMEVSIDVSTGEHDSGHRLFGVVTLVQENQKSKHGLILLVQEPEANFKEVLAQRTWVGLFDEEIEVLFQTAAGPDEEVHIRFARAIESKLKEVNT